MHLGPGRPPLREPTAPRDMRVGAWRVGSYVCTCIVYIYIYIYTYMYTHMYMYIYIYIYMIYYMHIIYYCSAIVRLRETDLWETAALRRPRSSMCIYIYIHTHYNSCHMCYYIAIACYTCYVCMYVCMYIYIYMYTHDVYYIYTYVRYYTTI